MHIERILLRDVGPFDDVTIELPDGKDPNIADVYLLTGPNGSGKSTVLYALAAVIAMGFEELGKNLLTPRTRSKKAMAAFESSDGRTYAALTPDLFGSSVPTNPFDNKKAFLHLRGSNELHYYASDGGTPRYAEIASTYRPKIPTASRPITWATFAYSGNRPVSEVHITAIQEPKESPFKNSLSFLQTADTDQLANWIISQNYRRLMAREAGDRGEAEQLARSVRRIEESIADIIGDPDFGFVIAPKGDDVHVRWRGAPVRLGVLPDGLQSIVSWIADLLMRLDRIPWQDNTPVEQRRFLLLLDEIDIHLHPAWQRRVLPFVQKLFPNAQIIASTHSPFVVGSLADGCIISLDLKGSSAKVVHVDEPQLGVSYSAVLRSIFGIESEFDVDTEHKLQEFHAARRRLLGGDEGARADVERIADELKQRSEELRGLMALELGQMRRQLAQRAVP
jgi:energy-coupling factor transporter ATP-binding protein EcfA2